MKHAVLLTLVICFTGAQTLAPSLLRADVMKCKIDGFSEKIFITTSPDTNQSDGQYARIGISPGAGNRALAFADRMGAHVFIELNTDGTPIGLFTVQKDLHVINARQSIDPSGSVLAPSQSAGACSRCVGLRACLH